MIKLIMISINWKLNSISTLLEILIAKIAKLHIKSAHFETSKNIYSFFKEQKVFVLLVEGFKRIFSTENSILLTN